MFKTIACMLAFVASSASAAFAAGPAVPPAFAGLVPVALSNGLKLVDIRNRCTGCEPWRLINFRSNDAPAPVRQERVSVQEGVTAMYAFPGRPYFANTKIERSIPGRYEQDKAIVTEALTYDCARMKARVLEYIVSHPDVREKEGNYTEFELGSYKGVEYASCAPTALWQVGGTPGQIQIFIPQDDTIVTAYLLNQQQAKFRTIEEFQHLRREFIEGYIEFLVQPGSAR
jgi:hypothetical protein